MMMIGTCVISRNFLKQFFFHESFSHQVFFTLYTYQINLWNKLKLCSFCTLFNCLQRVHVSICRRLLQTWRKLSRREKSYQRHVLTSNNRWLRYIHVEDWMFNTCAIVVYHWHWCQSLQADIDIEIHILTFQMVAESDEDKRISIEK